VLTGLGDRTAAIKALQGGAQDYLVKGQDTSSSLARCIRYAITRQDLETKLGRTLQWEKEGWMRRQAVRDYRRYVALSKDSRSILSGETEFGAPDLLPEPDEKALRELVPAYRELVLTYTHAEHFLAGEPVNRTHELTRRLADIGARGRDLVRLHLSTFSDFSRNAEPADVYQDFLTESRLVMLELMAGLVDLYLYDSVGQHESHPDRQ
jgi:hypothetical protein